MPGSREEDFKEVMHFHFKTYIATQLHKNLSPGIMKFTILIDSSLLIITIHLVCMVHASE